MAAMMAHRPWKETDAGVRYLWWMSAPMFVVFGLFSLRTNVEPNWPVTAYLSGAVLAAPGLHRRTLRQPVQPLRILPRLPQRGRQLFIPLDRLLEQRLAFAGVGLSLPQRGLTGG